MNKTNFFYIEQKMNQASDLKYFLDEDNDSYYITEKKEKIISLTINDILASNHKRYMVVDEPGYGKTRLLKEIVLRSKNEAIFIDAKRVKDDVFQAIKRCKYFDVEEKAEEDLQNQRLFKNYKEREPQLDNDTIVCIDALDEVPFYELSSLFEKIEEFLSDYEEVKLILSCRTHHIQKMEYNIKQFDFHYVNIKTFSGKQIKDYLEYSLQKPIDLEELYSKSKISNLIDFIRIPRYLYYFSALLKEGSLDEVVNLSRAEMFEHFIYRKLNKELKEKTPQSQIDLLKRVLEKLALIMKINQVSVITKDELMSIFDKMDSNFSQIAFRDDLLQKLYDRSLIKDNIDSIEFENQEFLDYLSAKELARFEKVEQTFFDVAIEPHLDEVYVSWFYVLPFLFELKPFMIELFLDYLDRKKESALSSEYFTALLNIEADTLYKKLKSRIFDRVFDYYFDNNKLLSTVIEDNKNIVYGLARYYDDSKYIKILEPVNEYETNETDKNKYKQINSIKLVEALIKFQKLNVSQIEFWKNKISEWFLYYQKRMEVQNILLNKIQFDDEKIKKAEKFWNNDKNYHEELYLEIIKNLATIANDDFEWIKSLNFILNSNLSMSSVDELYAHACFLVAPNDKFSINIYIDEAHPEYIFQLKNIDNIIYALTILYQKDKLDILCEYYNSWYDYLQMFQKKLNQFYNEELGTILKKIVKTYKKHNHCNKIIKIFIEVLVQNDNSYLQQLVNMLYESYKESIWKFRYENICILDYINKNNFDSFLKQLDIFQEDKSEIILILYSRANDEIKEIIKKYYPKEILERQKRIEENNSLEKEYQENLCKKWINCSNPLEYYTSYKDNLINCSLFSKGFQQTVDWIRNILQNDNYHNGLDFKDAIRFAFDNKVELNSQAKDNIFKFLPNALSNECKMFLDLAQNPSEKAIQELIEIYRNDKENHIYGLIEFYQKTKREELEELLLDMLDKDFFYDKDMIIDILPNNILTKEKIKEKLSKLNEKSPLYEKYLCQLIEKYNDKDAIEKAIKWVKKRAENLEEEFDAYLDTPPIAFALTNSDYSLVEDKELLNFASELYTKNKIGRGNFIRDEIVYKHIEYLLKKDEKNGLEAINIMEKHTFQNKKTLYNFQYNLIELKEAYLSMQKSKNIIASINKYNELQKNDYIPISSPIELLETIKEVINKDIRSWIEDEGAYKFINELSKKTENKNAEDFIQKSLKSQIELALLKRGFRETDFSIKREEQTMADKRLDFTISYGFIGSVVLELKLSHNSEAIATRQNAKDYVSKLQSYIKGSNSSFGLFVIFNIEEEKEKFDDNILNLIGLYENEENISVLGLDCVNI